MLTLTIFSVWACSVQRAQRVKGWRTGTYTLGRDEVAGLQRLRGAKDDPLAFVCVPYSAPISTDTVVRIVAEAVEAAGASFRIHRDMLRHSVGHRMADWWTPGSFRIPYASLLPKSNVFLLGAGPFS